MPSRPNSLQSSMSHTKHSHRHHGKPRESSSSASIYDVPSQASEVLFTTDRKGDIQNLRYGSIDKYKVPKYRTAGYGRLLGLDRTFRVVSNSGNERQVDNEALDVSNKNHGFPLLLKRHCAEEPSLLRKKESFHVDELAEQQDYITLGQKRRKPSNREALPEGECSDVQSRINASNRHHSDSLSESKSETSLEEHEVMDSREKQDAFEIFKNHPDNRKYIQLKNLTDQDPQNVGAWLDLIGHQGSYFMLSAGDSRLSPNASERRTVTDMKLSLFERAILVVRNQQAKEKLILGMMNEGAKIWDTDRQLKKWQSILTATSSIDLWYEFLNFQQTNTITFSYERCVDAYLEVMRIASYLDPEDHDYHRTYLTLRLTTFMCEAGFSERAIAIWQAILEYNFFSPVDGNQSVKAFEMFWESEHPRIGEEGAKGWCSGMEQDVPSRTDGPLVDLDSTFLFSDWGRAEAQRAANDTMPARTLDETVEDDPFRVILFSDVKDFVFKTKVINGNSFLEQGFLKFCGLPPTLDGAGRCRKWWTNSFLCDFTTETAMGALTDTSTLFAQSGSPLHLWGAPDLRTSAMAKFAVQALKQLVHAKRDDDQLAEYTIALELSRNPPSARKFAKALLKERSNSLRLYNAYALVEVRSGRLEVANNVWSTALSMADSFGSAARPQKIGLWHSWIWELMEQERYEYALNLLSEAVPSESITTEMLQPSLNRRETSSAQRLRADAYFRDQISDILTQEDGMIAEFTALYALLKYVRNGKDLNEAIHVCQSTLSLLDGKRSPQTLECLHQWRARLIHFHTISSPTGYRPMQLVSLFGESKLAFPENSIFSSLHQKYLQRAGVVDRIRILGNERESISTTVTSSLYAIMEEMSRPTYSGSTTQSLRHAFASATDITSQARYCPAVWLSWMKWELSVAFESTGLVSRQVKDVYLSALRSCVWCKDLYLQCFVENHTSKTLSDRELEQIYRSMSERGLRVRHDISETLDEMAEAG